MAWGETVWVTFCWMPLVARIARSILIPPEVDPEHPQINEQTINTATLSDGHTVVSSVAKPVVVEMDTTWKEASRKADQKEL